MSRQGKRAASVAEKTAFRTFTICSAYSMTRLSRWISRCLGIIQISLTFLDPEDDKMVRLDLKFRSPTKTKRNRTIEVPDLVAEWIDRHRGRIGGPLFLNPRTGKRWSHWALRESWFRGCDGAALARVGLYEGTKHSFATDALDRTQNERAVQEYLGHTDPASTRRYAKLRPHALAEVVRPDFGPARGQH